MHIKFYKNYICIILLRLQRAKEEKARPKESFQKHNGLFNKTDKKKVDMSLHPKMCHLL